MSELTYEIDETGNQVYEIPISLIAKETQLDQDPETVQGLVVEAGRLPKENVRGGQAAVRSARATPSGRESGPTERESTERSKGTPSAGLGLLIL